MLGEPGFAIQEHFFTSFFKPHLNKELSGDNYYYFLDESWTAWRLGVKKKDIDNMLFVEWVCGELYKEDQVEFSKMLSYLLDQDHDSQERISQSEKEYFDSRNSKEKNIVKIFSAALRHYKVFFESEFRLWSTIPYYFSVKRFGKKSGGTTPDTYVEIPASNKYQTLKDIKVILPQGNLSDLVDGFDNTIRNAGEGHDRYEVTDSNTVVLHDIDPITGKHKGKKEIELTQTGITSLIDKCRKTLWILRNGVMLFITNNPEVAKDISRIRPMKIREIEGRIKVFANTRWIDLKEFNYEKDNNKIYLRLDYIEKHIGISSELILGNGERYDLIDIETKVKYKHQVWGILQQLLYVWVEPYPMIEIKLYDNKNHLISEVTYAADELKKLLLGKRYEPIPVNGSITEDEYMMVGPVRVPYGSRKFSEEFLESKGHKVRKLI